MTQVLDTRASRISTRPLDSVMTCDIPVARDARRSNAAGAGTRMRGQQLCRPTGRDAVRRRSAVRTVRSSETVRRRPEPVAPRSNTPARTFRRRRAIAGLLLGAVAALGVAMFAMIGQSYEAAVTEQAPAATEVIHVRSGESLSSLAGRVAPGHPVDAVIAQIRRLNGLETAGLLPGQALIVPGYR